MKAKGTSRTTTSLSQSAGAPARRLKYIAKRPAKNMTSLPSQTMVPTEVEFGLLMTVFAAWGIVEDDIPKILTDRRPWQGPEASISNNI